MSAYLSNPEAQEYEALILTREQVEFLLRFYEIDPYTGQRTVRRGVISRPRGWGKSPFTAAIAALEALGPTLFAGWDSDGRPVGRPWSDIKRPLVEIAAVSEDQVNTNTWAPLLDIMASPPLLDAYPGIELMQGFINLPYGRIQKRTAEARSAKGAPAHFVCCDQTEMWTPSNGGVDLYKTLKNNVIKRGGHIIESPNAFTPGMASVAESTMTAYMLQREGKTKRETGVYFDHREAPPETNMGDRESLMRGLAIAYGDSAKIEQCAIHNPPCVLNGWSPIDTIADSVWDPDTDLQLAASDFLNQITHASDSYLSSPAWAKCKDDSKTPGRGDTVVLGFDGSRGRAKGKPDATALIGCRVNDGHVFTIGVWEAGEIPSHDPSNANPPKLAGCDCWKCWEPSIVEIESEIAAAFTRYRVVAFYADPGKDWRSYITGWEQKYLAHIERNDGLKVSAAHPFEWWMGGGRATLVERAVEQFSGAVFNGDMTHDNHPALTRHVLNSRRRLSHGKLALGKENDYSPKKIDAAVAAVLAYQARLDALSRVPEQRSTFYVPSQLY